MKKWGIIAGFVVISSAVLIGSRVFSYDTDIAHPFLTLSAARVFNDKYPGKLTNQEIDWLSRGAVAEDTPIRWMNHFYDPNSGSGLIGFDSARDWSRASGKQAWYPRADQSWSAAIDYYLSGDFESAFVALGHNMHLVEDMAVPAHTRLDIHPFGDPYEQWVKNNQTFPLSGATVSSFDNIDDYFYSLAKFSSDNFFSEDTIDYEIINKLPTGLFKEGSEFVKCKYKLFDDKKICIIKFNSDKFGNIQFFFNEYIVNSDYHSILGPKAISFAAGLIELFFKEVEKTAERQNNQKVLGQLINNRLTAPLTGSAVSPAYGQSAGQITSQPNQPPSPVAPITPVPPASNPTLIPANPSAVRPSPQATPVPQTNTYSGGSSSSGSGGSSPSSPPTITTVSTTTVPTSITPTSTPIDTTPTTTPTSSLVVAPPAPTLSSGFFSTVYTTSSAATITGACSTDTVQIAYYYSASATPSTSSPSGLATPSGDSWFVSTTLIAGHDYFYFAAIDSTGATSSLSDPAHFVLDTVSPPTPAIAVVDRSGLSDSSLRVSLSGVDALSPHTFFDLYFATSSASTTVWQEIFSGSTTLIYDFAGTRGQSYIFRARSRDDLGNYSDWSDSSVSSTPTYIDWSKKIVINEVAWAGTSNTTASEEWIELYNNSDTDILFASTSTGQGHTLRVAGTALSWKSIAAATIAAHGYYLIERTGDTTVANVTADAIFTLSGGISNSGAKIELFDPAGEKIDEVDCASGWFAGGGTQYRSMERVSPLARGSDSANWRSNLGPRSDPRTSKGGYVYGSPRSSNFGNAIIMDNDQEAAIATWDSRDNPIFYWYHPVSAGKTLNIATGTVIKSFAQTAALKIYGNLNIFGTESEPVVITSGHDQSFTDPALSTVGGNWSGTEVSAGDWQGIQLFAGATATLNNFELRYGGHAFIPPGAGMWTPNVNQSIRTDDARLSVGHGKFSDCAGTAIYSKNSTTTITDSTITGGARAVEVYNSALTMAGVSIANTTDTQAAVYIKDRLPSISGLSFSGNSADWMFIESATVSGDQTLTRDLASASVFSALTVPASTTLTIDPGSTVRIAKNTSFDIFGTLSAIGSPGNEIYFTALSDSAKWGQLRFVGSTSTFSHVTIEKGNSMTTVFENTDGMIGATDSNIRFDHTRFLDPRRPYNSVQGTNSNLRFTDCEFSDSVKYENLWLNAFGVRASGGSVAFDNTSFSNIYGGVRGIGAAVSFANMSSSGFNNIDVWWSPADLGAL